MEKSIVGAPWWREHIAGKSSISHLDKECHRATWSIIKKFLLVYNSMWAKELPDVQARFRKGRGTRDQIDNIHWIIEKAKEFQKNIYFYFIDFAKAFDCVDHKTEKFLKRWEYQNTLAAS